MHAYRNTNTNQTVVVEEPSPRLEALPNWELLQGSAAEEALAGVDMVAYDRKRAEQAAIAGSAENRAAQVGAEGLGSAAAELIRSTNQGTPAVVPTLVHKHPVVEQPQGGVLSRAKADQREGNLQIGKQAAASAAAVEDGSTPEAPPAEGEGDGGEGDADAVKAPAETENKPVWVAWASEGYPDEDKRITAAEAEALTKAELVKRFGTV